MFKLLTCGMNLTTSGDSSGRMKRKSPRRSSDDKGTA